MNPRPSTPEMADPVPQTSAETNEAVRRTFLEFVQTHQLNVRINIRTEENRVRWAVRLGHRRLHLATTSAETEEAAMLAAMNAAAAKIDDLKRIARGGLSEIRTLMGPGLVGIAGLCAAIVIAYPSRGVALDETLPPPPPKLIERAAPAPLFPPEFNRA